MSFGPCEIVKIVADNESGYIVINASDFDEKTQTLYEGSSAPDFEPHTSQDGWGQVAEVNNDGAITEADVEVKAKAGK